jgi:hypothetical protein
VSSFAMRSERTEPLAPTCSSTSFSSMRTTVLAISAVTLPFSNACESRDSLRDLRRVNSPRRYEIVTSLPSCSARPSAASIALSPPPTTRMRRPVYELASTSE